jgi:hypothetical protein
MITTKLGKDQLPYSYFPEVKQAPNFKLGKAKHSKCNDDLSITCKTIPNFKPYYRAITIQTAWCWHKKKTGKPVDQNREPRHKPTHLQPTDL